VRGTGAHFGLRPNHLMKDQEKQQFEKSIRYVDRKQGQSGEIRCARATAWGPGGQRLASGEVDGQPCFEQVQSGRFWPDDAALMNTLETYARYVSMDWPLMLPVKVTGACREKEDEHIQFEVTGAAVRFHHSQVRG
jgi:hypothetical protein